MDPFPQICGDDETTESAPASELVLQKEWLTLAEVIERTGISQSTLERRAATGAIQSRLEKRPGRKPERLYYAPDVDREKAGHTSRSLSPVPKPAELMISKEAVSSLEEMMTKWRDQPPALKLTEKLWLTLPEASAYSGFGEGYLRKNIGAGILLAKKAGPRSSWVIERATLERFSRNMAEFD